MSNKDQFRTVLNSKKDITQDIINSNTSKINMENIAKHTIKVIQGDKIITPKRQFLSVKSISIDNINQNEMIEAKNLFDLQKNFKKLKEESEEIIMTNIDKSKKVINIKFLISKF